MFFSGIKVVSFRFELGAVRSDLESDEGFRCEGLSAAEQAARFPGLVVQLVRELGFWVCP